MTRDRPLVCGLYSILVHRGHVDHPMHVPTTAGQES